jgi:hypothetical protein
VGTTGHHWASVAYRRRWPPTSSSSPSSRRPASSNQGSRLGSNVLASHDNPLRCSARLDCSCAVALAGWLPASRTGLGGAGGSPSAPLRLRVLAAVLRAGGGSGRKPEH